MSGRFLCSLSALGLLSILGCPARPSVLVVPEFKSLRSSRVDHFPGAGSHDQELEDRVRRQTLAEEILLVDLDEVVRFDSLDLPAPLRFECPIRAAYKGHGPASVSVRMRAFDEEGGEIEKVLEVPLMRGASRGWGLVGWEIAETFSVRRLELLFSDPEGGGTTPRERRMALRNPRILFGREIPANVVSRRRVILLTVDSLRADALSCYDPENADTPNLQVFAESAVLFRSAFSPSNATLPSHVSLLTATYPKDHGVQDNQGSLGPEVPTVLDRFREARFATAAFVSCGFLGSSGSGLDERFDEYSECEASRARRAEETNGEVIRWLNQNFDRDFFLWVHYFDPHYPYRPPYPDHPGVRVEGAGAVSEEERLQESRELYRREVEGLDARLGVLLEQLRLLGIFDSSVIAFVGSYGECLGEGGQAHHHRGLSEASTWVPLLLKLPGQDFGAEWGGLSSPLDLLPTLADSVGLDVGSMRIRGRSLWPRLVKCSPESPFATSDRSEVFSEHSNSLQVSVRTENRRFVLGRFDKSFGDGFETLAGRERLLDVSSSSGAKPLPEDSDEGRSLRRKLDAFLADRLAFPSDLR